MCIRDRYISEPQSDFFLERDLTLSFDNSSRRQCFDVEIIADQDDGEGEEFFSIVISLIQFLPGVSIDFLRDTAVVTILQNVTTPPCKHSSQLLEYCNLFFLNLQWWAMTQ